MRLMTANLLNTRVDTAALVRVLDEWKPNVVATQELDFTAADILSERYPHGLVRPGGVPGHGLLADFPIEVVVHPLPFRPLLTAAVALDGRTVTVGCIHLANPVGISDVSRRPPQVRALLEVIEGDGPMVLVGDLNSSPAWPAYRMIRRHLDDGVAEWAERSGRRPPRTWNFRPHWPKVLRIDHAMVRGVTVNDVHAVDIEGTDHRALIVDVS
ncbi:MAG: endonuclease/exonuclease/phosphatase family protein [Acidimicrobiia bacterium]|nr:endonuclease/exonuclease/phosphatase family protein [Acidimicrobiia bacterium]